MNPDWLVSCGSHCFKSSAEWFARGLNASTEQLPEHCMDRFSATSGVETIGWVTDPAVGLHSESLGRYLNTERIGQNHVPASNRPRLGFRKQWPATAGHADTKPEADTFDPHEVLDMLVR
ncbi:hypothetical protein N9L68_02130 [bacterium]|nr:hypothetical protein [bacterium]